MLRAHDFTKKLESSTQSKQRRIALLYRYKRAKSNRIIVLNIRKLYVYFDYFKLYVYFDYFKLYVYFDYFKLYLYFDYFKLYIIFERSSPVSKWYAQHLETRFFLCWLL